MKVRKYITPYVIPDPSTVIPDPSTVIPAKAGIQSFSSEERQS